MTTVGYGDITAWNVFETSYAIFMVFVSATLFTGIIAHIDSGTHGRDTLAAQFHLQLDYVSTFIKQHRLPEAHCQNVLTYFNNRWLKSRAADAHTILDSLTDQLRKDIALVLNKCVRTLSNATQYHHQQQQQQQQQQQKQQQHRSNRFNRINTIYNTLTTITTTRDVLTGISIFAGLPEGFLRMIRWDTHIHTHTHTHT